MPKYLNINVKLTEENGNAFVILGKVQREMRKAGLTKEEINKYVEEATSGDYDKLLQVTMEYVNVE